MTRDAAISRMGEVGSGYPSDPRTVAYLEGFVKAKKPFPASVRTRWGTVRKLCQQELF